MVNILTIIVLSCIFLKTYEKTVYCGLIVCYSSENMHLLKLPKNVVISLRRVLFVCS